MLKIKELKTEGYEKVIEAIDPDIPLHCFIAIHDSTLGPAVGGTRIYPYPDKQAALNDALRLAKGMTYKSAIVGNGLGGGKSVIIADPETEKTEKLLLAFGEVVNELKGQYIAAEDLGTSEEDMLVIRRKTPYVAALPTEKSSGDPSRFTAWGVFRGMQAVAQHLWGNPSLRRKTVAIQGVGHVGGKLADLLFWEGARLIVSDTNKEKVHHYALLYGAEEVEDIFSSESDIFAPCAMGGIINDETIPQLHCAAVAGSANNQLLDRKHGDLLMDRGILYAPDYIINSGGIINAAGEFEPGGYNPRSSRNKVNRIYDVLLLIFEKSKQEGKSTSKIADELAEYNLSHGIGKRTTPLRF